MFKDGLVYLLMVLLVVLLVVSSGTTFANSAIGKRTVSMLIVRDSGNLYVYFNGATTHTEACGSQSTYILPKDDKHFSEIYSGLLAALHAKTPVNGYVNGCVNVSGKTKTKITRIDFL